MRRRAFLRKTALYAPVILAAPSVLAKCKDENPKPGLGKKVLVVGAGLAGIHAAHLLLQRGYEVVVLEASDRWGGRIRSLQGFADFDIELGAEEVHGEKSSWHDLVERSPGLRFADDAASTDYYWLDSALRTEAQVESDPDGERALAFEEDVSAYEGPDKTVQQEVESRGFPNRVRHILNAQVGNEFGTSNNRLSIKGIAEEGERWSAGEANRLVANRSYRQVMEQAFPEALATVVLNSPVQKVDYTGEMVRVDTTGGQSYTAHHVILTVPLPILRDGDIGFDPPLPAEKQQAMQKIGMGAGMKIILRFSERFWPADTGSIIGAGPVPEYWYTALGRGSTPVLTAFVMGEKAEQLGSLGNGAVQAVLADLDAMFAGAATPRFAAAEIMDWAKMPYVRGAYSFPVVGGGIAMRERLAAPVAGKLFFAGEATHSGGHSGTMHGAFESASRVVGEL